MTAIPAGIIVFALFVIGMACLFTFATAGRADGFEQDARDGGERG